MTYAEAMQFWFDRVNFEQKSPLAGDLSLDRIRQLLAVLGNPHDRLRIVHIAGSKGKGSTSALLASILEHEGYRVGLFTSPHLLAVEERIQVDRQPITPDELTALMTEIRAATPPKLLTELTFFEIGTALGFLHFVRRRVDFAMIEVGLGGRFDSTNVCTPLLAIITSISLDHTQILGGTRAKIAREKAGIIKPRVPVISGVREAEAGAVIEKMAREQAAPLTRLEVDFRYEHEPALFTATQERWPSVNVMTRRRRFGPMALGLIGEHQAQNAAVALAAVEELTRQGIAIRPAAVAAGLARVQWPARLEILGRQPTVLLDCAHNVASAQALVQALETSFPRSENARRLLVFAGSQDKDLPGMLECLGAVFNRIYLTSFRNPRCAPPNELLRLLPAALRGRCEVCPSSGEAWGSARAAAQPIDLICVTGSVFLAGEMRPRIMESELVQ